MDIIRRSFYIPGVNISSTEKNFSPRPKNPSPIFSSNVQFATNFITYSSLQYREKLPQSLSQLQILPYSMENWLMKYHRERYIHIWGRILISIKRENSRDVCFPKTVPSNFCLQYREKIPKIYYNYKSFPTTWKVVQNLWNIKRKDIWDFVFGKGFNFN